ncbi:MAG: leucine-rich repeat domain-containing protein [Bacilli bacterium]|nr:leucine-rich repeat domain-containing protein [Bacilli bacterium]
MADGATIVKINNPKLKTLLEDAKKGGLCIEPFMEDSEYDFSVENHDCSIVDGCPTDLDDLKDYILQLIEVVNQGGNRQFKDAFEAEYPNLKDSFSYVYWSYVPDDQTRESEHLDDVIEFKYGKPGRKKASNNKKKGTLILKDIFPGIDMTKPRGLIIDGAGCCSRYDRKQHAEFLGEENCLFFTKDVKTIKDRHSKIYHTLAFYDKCVVTTDLEDLGRYEYCCGFHLFYIIDAETNEVVYSSKKDRFRSNIHLEWSDAKLDELHEVLCKYTKTSHVKKSSKASTKTIDKCSVDISTGRLTKYGGVKDVVLPNEFKVIGKEAFEYGNITSIVIPEGVEIIDNYAFHCCNKLKSVTLPNTLKSIGDGAFWECELLTSIVIPEGVKTIDVYAFSKCNNLEAITLPNTLKGIGEYAFNKCEKLTSIVIPVGAETIDDYAFSSCYNLKSVTLPNTIKKIGKGAFSSCKKLTSIVIPEGVETIDDHTFSGCQNLKSVTLPNTLKKIGRSAFFLCEQLVSIVIPGGVETIDDNAFSGCKKLKPFTLPNAIK